MSYKVFVDDGYDYMDESKRYALDVYETYEEAVGAAKELVWENLCSMHRRGMTAEELFEAYRGFGEDPFVVAIPPAELVLPVFSARGYALEQCQELCTPNQQGGSQRPWWKFWRAVP